MFASLAVIDSGPLTRRVAVAAHELGVMTTLVPASDAVQAARDAGADALHVADADVTSQLSHARACAATGLWFVGADVGSLTAVVDPIVWHAVAGELDIEVSDCREERRLDIQVLADSGGEVVHLREREVTGDDSVVMAPAPRLSTATRNGMCRDAVRLVGALGLTGAVTVSMEVEDEAYAVTDVLPGLQLSHTVTEEVTNLDLVQAQLHLAAGRSLLELGLSQESIIVRGYAIQCRVTAYSETAGAPWQVPGGPGVRIDRSGTPALDVASRMVTAMTCRGRDLVQTLRRTRRALTEFETGAATNVPELHDTLSIHP